MYLSTAEACTLTSTEDFFESLKGNPWGIHAYQTDQGQLKKIPQVIKTWGILRFVLFG